MYSTDFCMYSFDVENLWGRVTPHYGNVPGSYLSICIFTDGCCHGK